jgi:hypothetical protein
MDDGFDLLHAAYDAAPRTNLHAAS